MEGPLEPACLNGSSQQTQFSKTFPKAPRYVIQSTHPRTSICRQCLGYLLLAPSEGLWDEDTSWQHTQPHDKVPT